VGTLIRFVRWCGPFTLGQHCRGWSDFDPGNPENSMERNGGVFEIEIRPVDADG